MKHKVYIGLAICSIVATSTFLIHNSVRADSNTTDDISVSIPVACSMTSTLNSAHTAIVNPGTYEEGIGETVFNVFCNDSEGFSVYAIGFSADSDGNTTMIPSNVTDTYAIATGTATSGSTSNWAMKLTAVSGDHAPTLGTGFNAYHAIPSDYAKVAYYYSSTDATVGSSFKTTYATFVSQTQPADTYNGKVKYTVVHPSSVTQEAMSNVITVNFDGNGLSFSDDSETNTIQYAEVCGEAEQAYVGTSHQDVASSNFDESGNKTGSYTDSESVLQSITYPDADKLKIVVDYGVTGDSIGLVVAEGNWDGDFNNLPENNEELFFADNTVGTKSFIFNGNTTTIYIESWNTPETGYDYGYNVKVYPIYNNEQPNTALEELPCDCWIQSISGSYEETTTWKGRWDLYIDGAPTESFSSESDLLNYINENYDDLKGKSITISAYNPINLVYDGNGASSEFSMGVHGFFSRDWGQIPIDLQGYSNDTLALLAPNFKRSGYGFIGWSFDRNAANNLSTAELYGPNEIVTINDTFLNHKGDDNNVTLYATWLPSAGNIQNWSGCSSMSIGGVTALSDTRDNNTYAVAKLEDGNCWMIENLRLGGYSSISLSTSDTQSAGTLPAASNDYLSWSTYQNNININIMNLNPSGNQTVSVIDGESYGFGAYYTYMAAINTTVQPAFGGEATTSICPSGWSLPSSTIYTSLIDAVGNAAENFTSFPNNFVTAGYASGSRYKTNRPSNISIANAVYTSSKYADQNKPSDVFVFAFRNYAGDRVRVTNYSEDTNSYYQATKIGYGRSVRCLVN